jgi:hypothetical protein
VIIIENGELQLDRDAAITAVRTTIVFAGTNTFSAKVEFPNGEGQSAALTISPSMSDDNPWRGIAMYRDPSLTRNVQDNWGPGATFNADGVVYLPNTDLQMRGIAGSGNSRCTKFVTRTFETHGSVTLDFAHNQDGCKNVHMHRWADVPAHLTH